jgi:hypothetical protein
VPAPARAEFAAEQVLAKLDPKPKPEPLPSKKPYVPSLVLQRKKSGGDKHWRVTRSTITAGPMC